MVKRVAIVQARMGSVRCPKKVMRPVCGVPLIKLLLRRLYASKVIDQIVLATSTSLENDELASFVHSLGLAVFRGAEHDVLDRYYQAAKEHNADIVVRITGDCPVIDPAIVDQVVQLLESSSADYASNVDPPTFPDGLDVEAFRFAALEEAWKKAETASDREHVTPFLRESTNFSRISLAGDSDYSMYRWTVDEPVDFELMETIFSEFGTERVFPWQDVIPVMKNCPERFLANRHLKRNSGSEMSTGQKLWTRAKSIIPGGSQLLSKRAEMFHPVRWPAYYKKAKGSRVWDLDGREYIDMSYNGIGACVLGAADPDVDAAAIRAIHDGTMSTLNCPEEVELAELLCELHPWASKVRYARTGGEALAMAVRIARAATGKDVIAFCGYHGWHDWYLAANLADDHSLDGHLLPGLEPNGVPRCLSGTAFPFRYNDIGQLESIVAEHGGNLAAVVMEPIRGDWPASGFLQSVKELCEKTGAVLIFDEVTAAFRLNVGGAHLVLSKVTPDIAVFGKAISNGYAMAAVIGTAEIMEAAQSSFISSTYWTERIGPSAALATIKKYREQNVHEHLHAIGSRVRQVWHQAAELANLPISVGGIVPLSHFTFDVYDPTSAKTLLTQLMLERDFLASTAFYATYAHSQHDLDAYDIACQEIMVAIADACSKKTLSESLSGAPSHTGFARLT